MLVADLREARKSVGLKVREFAMLMGVSMNGLSNLESKGLVHRMFNIFLWRFCDSPHEGVVSALDYWAHQGALDEIHLENLQKIADRFIHDHEKRSAWNTKIIAARKPPPIPLARRGDAISHATRRQSSVQKCERNPRSPHSLIPRKAPSYS